MYNATETFHTEAFSASREITVRATFNDTVEIDGNHLKDITIEEIVCADNLSIGSTCSSKATVNMFMPEEAIPLSNGWMNLYVGIPTECPLGKYYIADVVTKDKYKTVTITAYDKMWHLNKNYVPGADMTFPANVRAVVEDIAEQNNFEVDFDSFPDYEISLVEATEREMLGYCAGLMGKNAKFNRDGKLTFVWFTDTDRDIPLEVQYQGGFSETTADSFVLGGLVSGTEENPLTAGSGRTITFSNPFMTQEILDGILNEVAGFTYTPCEVKYRCDPSFETGDIVDVVDDDSDVTAVYPVPIMAQQIKVGGGLNATIYAYGKSEESEVLIKAPSDGKIERVKGDLEKYLEGITGNIVGKNGGYYHITYDDLGFPNGWEIMNTPTLTPETKLWKMSAGGFGFSNDGGGNFSKLAFDMEGNFYADCIRGGSISTAGELGRNILIGEESIEIRNGETALASFKDFLIELGKGSRTAIIDLCDGVAKLYNEITPESSNGEYNRLAIESEHSILLDTTGSIRHNTAYGSGGTNSSAFIHVESSTPWSGNNEYAQGFVEMSATRSKFDLTTDDYYCYYYDIGILSLQPYYFDVQVQNMEGRLGRFLLENDGDTIRAYIDADIMNISTAKTKVGGGLYMTNDKYIYNKYADGSDAIMVAMNGSDQQLFGYGGYMDSIGESYFDGNKVYIRSNTHINFSNNSTSLIYTGGFFRKVSDSYEVHLGGASYRFGYIYLKNNPNVSSDIRLKENIDYNMDKYIAMVDKLKPMSYNWIYEQDNPNRKRNISYGAQYVWKAMKDVGLEETDFGGLQRNMQEEGPAYTYSLALEQFIPILHARQDRDKTELLARIERIEKALGISDAS